MAELVVLREVSKQFSGRGIVARARGGTLAVDRVSFSVEAGQTFGLVGESGCGKTTLARSILYLDPPTGGTVLFEGTPLGGLDPRELRGYRRRMQIVFQDPNGALDPKMRIRRSVAEGMINFGVPAAERARRTAELLELVGINPAHADRYPHEFSGGQKQRIVVARALSLDPEFLVLDEPVSNLDVSIQAQIINLLLDLKERLSLTYLFISHDLNLVAYLSDRIGVMYRGRLVELAATEEILGNPLHPYTRRLFAAAPGLGGPGPGQRPPGGRGPGERGPEGRGPAGPGPVGQGLGHPVVQLPVERPPGTESSAQRPQARGCRFGEQCTRAEPACRENDPELLDAGGGHLVACLRAEGAPGGAGKDEATRRQGTA